jgi:hypothetical protein
MKTLQPSELRPFTISVLDLELSGHSDHSPEWISISELRTHLQSDGVTFRFVRGESHGTALIIDGEDLTGEDLEASPEYQYLDSLLTR